MATRTELREAVLTHASRAAEKLRHQNLTAAVLQVFAQTNRFKPDQPQYHGAMTVSLPHPTQDARLLAQAIDARLTSLYQPGLQYQKAGGMLLELAPPGIAQTNLFAADQPRDDSPKSRKLMRVLDTINHTMGPRHVVPRRPGRQRAQTALAPAGRAAPNAFASPHLG